MSVGPGLDPRWQLLKDRQWTCRSCGGLHSGLFDLICERPDYWTLPVDPNGQTQDPKNFLNDDFCIIGREHFFIRCILKLPLVGADGDFFAYGVWSTLSQENFELYMRTFHSGTQAELGVWFGWLSNRIKGYSDSLNLKCHVHPQNGNERPFIELEPTGHPLAREQINGIDFDRMLEIYAINGHDME